MAQWPSILPKPAVTGYDIKPDDPVARTSFEQGPQRMRNRFTKAPTQISVAWRFSRQQFEIFESWHRHKINNGAGEFLVDLLTATGMNSYSAKFTKMWSSKPVGNSCVMWDVTASLEIADRIIMDESTLDTFL